jgi:general secretion pathway protein C
MNAILSRIQSSKFYTLIPVVILFTYALAYLIRMILIVLFATTPPISTTGPQNRQSRDTGIKSLSLYEEVVTGNFIRGIFTLPGQERSISGEGDLGSEGVDDPDADFQVVTGTLSGDASFARVTIREKSGITEEYAIGEEIAGGYKIRAIEQYFIILQRAKFRLKVLIGESLAQAKEKIKDKLPEEQPASISSSKPIVKTLSREDINKKLRDPTVLYKDARFGPHLVDGKIEGYKIYQVSRSHFFYALGARAGDIIKRVNGMPLQDTEKMMELWGSIKTAPKVVIDLDRKGSILTYEFQIKN